MAEFCKCGSIVIDGKCTNKNCAVHKASATAGKEKSLSGGSKSKASLSEGTQPAAKKTRRASKCIVYNLYDKPEE